MHKQLLRIERLHCLIKRKATGTPSECAERLQISERQLYNTLELMKSMGAPVYYDFTICAYCYEYEVNWQFGFFRCLQEKEMSKIQGSGNPSLNFSSLQFYFSERNYPCHQEAHTTS